MAVLMADTKVGSWAEHWAGYLAGQKVVETADSMVAMTVALLVDWKAGNSVETKAVWLAHCWVACWAGR